MTRMASCTSSMPAVMHSHSEHLKYAWAVSPCLNSFSVPEQFHSPEPNHWQCVHEQVYGAWVCSKPLDSFALAEFYCIHLTYLFVVHLHNCFASRLCYVCAIVVQPWSCVFAQRTMWHGSNLEGVVEDKAAHVGTLCMCTRMQNSKAWQITRKDLYKRTTKFARLQSLLVNSVTVSTLKVHVGTLC